MNPVNKRQTHMMKVFRNRFVGGQHELLNQSFGDGALANDHIGWVAVLVNNNLRFGKIKINRTAALAFFRQNTGQFFHRFKEGNEVTITFGDFLIFFPQYFTDVCIRHPLSCANDTRKNFVIDDFSLGCNFHLTGNCQPIHLRIQTANAVRQPVRNHRDDAIDKISACPALKRFFVKFRPFLDIIADIGDMNAELIIAIVQFGYGNCVIKIFRIGSVNRDNGFITEIAASFQLTGFNLIGNIICFL
ncbi:hypothetical protein KBTX_04329 [wastewater metagenome]|uniref:Uncharacterized protein n=2 Tax=unclassified sequences TaxID=12908 RepID=A0A5B8RIT6_9ZZZZ|nr:hypothetical protein KBTEX_04329 [uncultured organism]